MRDKASRRFHSMTFDAFSKSLIDRFSLALPVEYRPTADYVISFDVEKRMRDHLDSVVGDESGLTRADVSGISADRFYKRDFLGRAPRFQPPTPARLTRGRRKRWALPAENRGAVAARLRNDWPAGGTPRSVQPAPQGSRAADLLPRLPRRVPGHDGYAVRPYPFPLSRVRCGADRRRRFKAAHYGVGRGG